MSSVARLEYALKIPRQRALAPLLTRAHAGEEKPPPPRFDCASGQNLALGCCQGRPRSSLLLRGHPPHRGAVRLVPWHTHGYGASCQCSSGRIRHCSSPGVKKARALFLCFRQGSAPLWRALQSLLCLPRAHLAAEEAWELSSESPPLLASSSGYQGSSRVPSKSILGSQRARLPLEHSLVNERRHRR